MSLAQCVHALQEMTTLGAVEISLACRATGGDVQAVLSMLGLS